MDDLLAILRVLGDPNQDARLETYAVIDWLADHRPQALDDLRQHKLVELELSGRHRVSRLPKVLSRVIWRLAELDVISCAQVAEVAPWTDATFLAGWLREILPKLWPGKWFVRCRTSPGCVSIMRPFGQPTMSRHCRSIINGLMYRMNRLTAYEYGWSLPHSLPSYFCLYGRFLEELEERNLSGSRA